MKITLLLVVLNCLTAFAGVDETAAARISEALHRENIPELKLTRASLEEAISAIRALWERAHPHDPFPVGIVDFGTARGVLTDEEPRITLDLKNVPYIEALRYIGSMSFRQFSELRGAVRLEQWEGIREDWVTGEHPVTATTLRGLGLKPTASGDEVRKALQRLGVQFEDWMKAVLFRDGKVLVVVNRESQQHQIEGIILLIDQGFTITK